METDRDGAADSGADETKAKTRTECTLAFRQINRDRRAVRDFDGAPLADAEVEDLLSEVLVAPSSGNSQPYVVHWLRDPTMKAAGALACRNQRAARSASTLLVFVCGSRFALETASLFRTYVETSNELSERSREYHRRELKVRERFLRIATSAFWSPLCSILTAVFPSLTLSPIGPKAVRNWTARSTIFAVETLLLAASARGLDTCPIEGFDAIKMARILGLRRGDVIPVVVALGRRRHDAVIEPRWRRPFEAAVHVH